MKIALFTTSFPANAQNTMNSGVFVRDFAEALTDLDHEVWVLTPRKKDCRHEFRHAKTIFFPWLGQENSLTHIAMKNPIGALRLASVVAMGHVAAAKLIREFEPEHVLCFWVFPSGRELRLFPLPRDPQGPPVDHPSGVAVSPDGRYLATHRGNAVTLWDLNVVFPR